MIIIIMVTVGGAARREGGVRLHTVRMCCFLKTRFLHASHSCPGCQRCCQFIYYVQQLSVLLQLQPL